MAKITVALLQQAMRLSNCEAILLHAICQGHEPVSRIEARKLVSMPSTRVGLINTKLDKIIVHCGRKQGYYVTPKDIKWIEAQLDKYIAGE